MMGWKQVALSFVALAGTAAAAPPVRVSQLGWMAGDWVEEKQGAWTEERWAAPRAGVMLGTTLSGKGDRATEFEFTRISADPSGAVDHWASPDGGTAVPFRLVSASADAVVFENPKHDYPDAALRIGAKARCWLRRFQAPAAPTRCAGATAAAEGQAATSAFSARTVRPLSLTSAKPPSTGMRSGVSLKPLR